MTCVVVGTICGNVPSGKPSVLDLFSLRPEYIQNVCTTSITMGTRISSILCKIVFLSSAN